MNCAPLAPTKLSCMQWCCVQSAVDLKYNGCFPFRWWGGAPAVLFLKYREFWYATLLCFGHFLIFQKLFTNLKVLKIQIFPENEHFFSKTKKNEQNTQNAQFEKIEKMRLKCGNRKNELKCAKMRATFPPGWLQLQMNATKMKAKGGVDTICNGTKNYMQDKRGWCILYQCHFPIKNVAVVELLTADRTRRRIKKTECLGKLSGEKRSRPQHGQWGGSDYKFHRYKTNLVNYFGGSEWHLESNCIQLKFFSHKN